MMLTYIIKKVDKFFIKGVSLGLLGKTEESIQMYDMAFKMNPNFYDANHIKGLIFIFTFQE